MFWVWLIIVVFLGILEATTVNLVSIWFVASGLVAMILSFFTDNVMIQFGVFVILGVILMITTRKTLNKLFGHKEKTNLDRVVGMKGRVTETIPKDGRGAVKVDGKVWTAYANEEIKEGNFVKILEINGVKLKVEKWKE